MEKSEKILNARIHKSMLLAEKQLNGNSFLLGDTYTLAGVIWTVVLSRLDLLGYKNWIDGKDFPLLARYYQRAQGRKSFTDVQIQNEWWEK